jgi:hypothetical protein
VSQNFVQGVKRIKWTAEGSKNGFTEYEELGCEKMYL